MSYKWCMLPFDEKDEKELRLKHEHAAMLELLKATVIGVLTFGEAKAKMRALLAEIEK